MSSSLRISPNGKATTCNSGQVYKRKDCEGQKGFALAHRSTYMRVDLSAIWNNIRLLQAKCQSYTKIIAVIKANAYGHGAVEVAHYLSQKGVDHFGVATVHEGRELRENGVNGYIQVFGTSEPEEVSLMLEQDLTPTATSVDFIKAWSQGCKDQGNSKQKPVVVKVDTGLSRNGCQCEELAPIMQTCDELNIPVHSIMTHFSQAWDDPVFTKKQLDLFKNVTKPYTDKGIKIHIANSAAIIYGLATEMDFVRPGITIYGLTPDSSETMAELFKAEGFKPALAWLARPAMIKLLEPGRAVGYDQTYRTRGPEHIATFRLGYADGYNRLLSDKGVVSDEKGNHYPVVGRVSMDAITCHVTKDVSEKSVFYVIKDDYTSPNCARRMAGDVSTRPIPYEIGTSLSARVPRVYVISEDS